MLVNKPFQDIITFTRASAATRINSLGVRESVAANVPRIDYDPITLAVKGLLVEEQRTNLSTESEFRNGLTDATVRGGLVSAAALSGFSGALAFGHDGATDSYAHKNITVTAGTVVTMSVFVKMDDGNAPVFGSAAVASPDNDFALKAATNELPPNSYTVQPIGGGVYRVSASTSATAVQAGVIKRAANSSRTFKVTGYQFEVGAFATSYIPTTTAQVTRAADVASINALSPWFNPASMTIFTEFTEASDYSAAGNCVANISDGSANNSIYIGQRIGATTLRSGAMDSGGIGNTQLSLSHVVVSANTGVTNKTALAIAANDGAGCANGGPVSTDNTVTMASGLSVFRLGGRFDGGQPLNGWLRKLRYYPKRLTNAELQALTA